MFKCQVCNKKLKYNKDKIYENRVLTCGGICRIKFLTIRIKKTCLSCNKNFFRKENHNSEFCHHNCARSYNNRVEKTQKFEEILKDVLPPCAVCGKDRGKMGERFHFLCKNCENLESYKSEDWVNYKEDWLI